MAIPRWQRKADSSLHHSLNSPIVLSGDPLRELIRSIAAQPYMISPVLSPRLSTNGETQHSVTWVYPQSQSSSTDLPTRSGISQMEALQCSYCLSLSSALYAHYDIEEFDVPESTHQPSLKVLLQSAKLGCDCCRLFVQILQSTKANTAPKSSLAKFLPHIHQPKADMCLVRQFNYCGERSHQIDGRIIAISHGDEWAGLATLTLPPSKSSLHVSLCANRHISNSKFSDLYQRTLLLLTMAGYPNSTLI